jgi:hypothetical protein
MPAKILFFDPPCLAGRKDFLSMETMQRGSHEQNTDAFGLGLGCREVEVHGVPGITEGSQDGWQLKIRLCYGILDFRRHPEPAAPPSPVFTGIYGVKANLLNGQDVDISRSGLPLGALGIRSPGLRGLLARNVKGQGAVRHLRALVRERRPYPPFITRLFSILPDRCC